MNGPNMLRQRLAAILAADAAGYSRLMALNERATLVALDAARESFRTAIAAQHGRVVDMAGDSVLAIFETATSAVGAALAVQAALETSKLEGPAPGSDPLRFRIGIHLGEVIEKRDGTIYGDGVNIAARLQTLAEPGGIVVSEAVHGAVGGRLGVGFDDLGAREVKNIAEPVHAFRVLDGGVKPPSRRPRDRGWKRIGKFGWAGLAAALAVAAVVLWALPGAPGSREPSPPEFSAAVMPFIASGSDPADAALADMLTLSLATAVSQRTWATVAEPGRARALRQQGLDARAIGRDLHVRYLVEGEVTPRGEKVVVTARVVEAETTRQTSGREFEVTRALTEDQRRLLQMRITNYVIYGLWRAEYARSLKLAEPLTPMDLVFRGRAASLNDANASWRAGTEYFDRALRMDPNHVPALISKAMALEPEFNHDPGPPKPQLLAEMDALSARAIALEPREEHAWAARAWALMFLQRWGEAFAANDIAIALAPHNPSLLAQRASFLSLTGRQQEGEAAVLRAMEMDPPGGQFTHRILCSVRLLSGRYDEAAAACEGAATRIKWFQDQMLLTAIHAHRGDLEKMAIARAEWLKQQPGATIANNIYLRMSTEPVYRQQVEQHLLAGLRKAGIPER